MEDQKRKICIMQYLMLLSFGFLVSQLYASSDVILYDSFDETFEGRWIVSQNEDFKGVWEHAKSEGHDDYGLLVSQKARKYAVVKELDEPLDLKDNTVILQYEARFQNGLECGGAYLKYLRPQNVGWTPEQFDNTSPYTIMFGPDKCGITNKVHFILKHQNPRTEEYTEHHLKDAPPVPSDKLTHVYTAILRPNEELRILIDGQEVKKANFLSGDDFDPRIIPPRTIPDPNDKKPEDWDEREKIPDPYERKPDDWDENAPMEIEDEDAVKPEGWLDNEPVEIDDPEAAKPEDWDDEEDGEWEAPKIENPKCAEASGCGEWKRPKKSNPAYKGKWNAPLIYNLGYMGVWKPQEIENPEHFELDRPNFDPIAAIGIEIWTMQDGIVFDNVLIASDEKAAEFYRETAWKPKFEVEKDRVKDEGSADSTWLKRVQKVVFEYLYKAAELPFMNEHRDKVLDLIEKAEEQPNLVIGILTAIMVVFLTVFMKLVSSRKKQPANNAAAETKKTDAADDSENERSSKEKEEQGDSAATTRRRSTKRGN